MSAGQRPVDACAADPHSFGNLAGPDALVLQRADSSNVYGRFAALVDPRDLCAVDALALTFLANVGFELRDRGEHAEEQFARRCICIHARLLKASERYPLSGQPRDDRVEVSC